MLNLPARIAEWLIHLVSSQRAVAFCLIDGEQNLADAGGELENYGLAGLQCRQLASPQLPFLEGLLPLPESPFLIRSMNMANGRAADVHLLSDGEATWIVLLDVTLEHGEAQKVQQKAYDMTLLSQREARLISRLEAAHAELTAAHKELAESREELLKAHHRIQEELRDAERYVRAILPEPVKEPFAVEWLYVPSTELGGDSLGYHWIDDDHFALYLLDVSGHGVRSALLSVAAANTLRSGGLSDANLRRPEEVLTALNKAYQMQYQNNLYFTIWYGVYHRPSGLLRYASGGHPPPLLITGPGDGARKAEPLPGTGLPVGMLPFATYDALEVTLASPARLFVFSDGVFEISRPDGSMLEFDAFEEALARPVFDGKSELDELLRLAVEIHGAPTLDDDFSILKFTI